MADLSPLTHGYVRGRFLAGILDSADPGDSPDVYPLSGYVEFSLSANAVKVTTAEPDPATVFSTKLRVDLDSEGYLIHNGDRDIALLSTDDPATNPTDLQWRVAFFLRLAMPGKPVAQMSYPTFPFELPAGSIVDLTTVAPLLTPAPNTIIIKGDKGDKGDPGDGEGGGGEGTDGLTPELRTFGDTVQWKYTTEGAGAWRNLYTIIPGEDGDDGAPGQSAYQIAVANGFVGNQAAWLLSLRGQDGTDGDDGDPGNDGLSAYQLAQQEGFSGTLSEWLASLKGEQGDPADFDIDLVLAEESAMISAALDPQSLMNSIVLEGSIQ